MDVSISALLAISLALICWLSAVKLQPAVPEREMMVIVPAHAPLPPDMSHDGGSRFGSATSPDDDGNDPDDDDGDDPPDPSDPIPA